jgi:hypothetical protein
MFELAISEYFYNNNIDYSLQRKSILNNKISLNQKSEKNQSIYLYLRNHDFLTYILNDISDTTGNNKILKQLQHASIRFMILIMIYQYFILKDTALILNILDLDITIFLFIPLIVMFYSHINVFKKEKTKEHLVDLSTFEYHIYKKSFNYMFWFFTIIQLYILWLFLFKAKIFVMYEDLTWSNLGLSFYITYTFENKISFFYDYLEYCMAIRDFQNFHKDNMIIFLSEIDINAFINDIKSKKSLKFFIEDLCNNYTLLNNTLIEKLKEEYNNPYKEYYLALTNISELIVLWQLFIAYLDAFYIIYNPINPRMYKIILLVIKILYKYKF